MALLRVGQPPKTTRGVGRKPGIWAGHGQDAEELRKLADRHPTEWGVVLGRVNASKAQSVASAIKTGKAADFKPDFNGHFEAISRKSEDQANPPKNRKGQPYVLFDVWARYIKTDEKSADVKKAD